MARTAVYFDDSRGGRWFQNRGERVSEYLFDLGFDRLNASDIRQWVEEATSEEPEASVVVFATDEVPTEICRADSANVLIRRFLEAGGRVVWIGDTPFWSIHDQREGSVTKWEIGLPQKILGVYPLIGEQSEQVDFTDRGRELLSEKWYGTRPIAVTQRDGGWSPLGSREGWEPVFQQTQPFVDINVLAYSQVTLSQSGWNINLLQRVINQSEISVSKGGGFDVRFPTNQTGQTRTTSDLKQLQDEYLSREYANAWQVVLNSNYKHQGFYRLWDSEFGHLKEEMLENVYNVATTGLRNHD